MDLDLVLTNAALAAITQAGDDIQLVTGDHTLTCVDARIVNRSAAFASLPVQLECWVAWWAVSPCGLALSTTHGEYICIETVGITVEPLCARAAS